MTELVNVQTAARRLGVAPVTVRRWTASGFLPCVRTPGGHRRISVDDIEDLSRALGRGHLAARRARERELDTLIEVATALNSQLELTALLREIARAMTLLADCRFCAVSEYDRQSRTVRTLAEYDATGERLPAEEEYNVRAFPATRRALEEQAEVVVNVDDRFADAAEVAALRHGGDKSVLILPLVFSGESIGLIEATDDARTRRFSRQELRLFRAVAGQAAVALHNTRLFADLSESARRHDDLRDVVAALAIHVEDLASRTSAHGFLEGVARAVCDSCGALSCVATLGDLSAGVAGRGVPGDSMPARHRESDAGGYVLVRGGASSIDRASTGPPSPTAEHVAVDLTAGGHVTLTVAFAGLPAEGIAELLDLIVVTAEAVGRRLAR